MRPCSKLLLWPCLCTRLGMPSRHSKSMGFLPFLAFLSSSDYLRLGITGNWCKADLHMPVEGLNLPFKLPPAALWFVSALLQWFLPHCSLSLVYKNLHRITWTEKLLGAVRISHLSCVSGWVPEEHHLDAIKPVPEQEPLSSLGCREEDSASPHLPPAARGQGSHL